MKRLFLMIMIMISMIWVLPILCAQIMWEDAEVKKLVKKVQRKGYEMRLYKDKGFFILRYVDAGGKQLGLSYWRQNHKALIGDTYVHHYFSPALLKLDPSLKVFNK